MGARAYVGRVIRALGGQTVTYTENLTPEELGAYLRNGGAGETDSGAFVTPDSAMRVAAYFACVQVLASGLAQVPLILYKTTGKNKERATDEPLYTLLHDAPNEWQTAFEFWELMQLSAVTRGNAYALKTVVGGEVRELLPLPVERVKPRQDAAWAVMYDVTMPDGSVVPVPPERMLHVPGLGFNGLTGLSVVEYHRETFGVATQLTRHGARLFKHGANVSGVLEHPQKLSKEAADRLRESFDERYAGASNSHKTLLLEEGLKYNKTGMTPAEAQYLEVRKFTRGEIASIFRVPPHLIGDLDRSTNNNIEQQSLEFVMYTMAPWYRRFEQRVTKSLIPKKRRGELSAKFLVNALLRGDAASRGNLYRSGILSGWLTRNEARGFEDLNPIDGLDEPITPTNMALGADPQGGAASGDNPDNNSNNNGTTNGAKALGAGV